MAESGTRPLLWRDTTLFLMAVDERVRFGCASGALASYRRKIADGTGIEMAEVVPGFATRFEIEDVLAAIAPRPFHAVSGTEDKTPLTLTSLSRSHGWRIARRELAPFSRTFTSLVDMALTMSVSPRSCTG